MCASDFRLNVCQILTAAKSHKTERDRLLAKFKCRGVGSKGPRNDRSTWVPFADGVFLCQVVELENDLKPLLSYPSLPHPNREDNYLLACKKRPRLRKEPPNGYAIVSCGDHVIAYRPAERTVNATHLLRLVKTILDLNC